MAAARKSRRLPPAAIPWGAMSYARLLSVLFAWLSLVSAQPPALRALVVGNSRYQSLPAATASEADAELVSRSLQDPGLGAIVSFHLNLTHDAFARAIETFSATVQEGDTVLIFYSGYAAVDPERESVLLAVDHSVRLPRGYYFSGLLDRLEERKAGAVVAFIDGSRDCLPLAESAGMTRVRPVNRSLVLFSHRPESTLPHPTTAVSPFAQSIQTALAIPGLTLSGIVERVIVETKRQSKVNQAPDLALNSLQEIRVLRAAVPTPAPAPVVVRTEVVVPPKLVAGQLQESKRDRLSYSWIPPGEAVLGCGEADSECDPAERAAKRTIQVKLGFWITRQEVSIRAFDRFAKETGHRLPKRSQTNAEGQQAANPIAGVSWEDGQSYCAWAGGRLPTFSEWEYAARGGAVGSLYPWGNQLSHNHANYHGRDKKMRDIWDESNSAPAGSFEPNGYNLFDVIGNVREWVADDTEYTTNAVTPPGPSAPKINYVRGGDFAGALKALRLSAFEPRPSGERDNRTGFRCVLEQWPSDK